MTPSAEPPRPPTGEEFVRGLVAAVPEAFDGVDVEEEYSTAEDPGRPFPPGIDGWLKPMALTRAIGYVDMAVEGPLPDELAAVKRFFAYIEAVLEVADDATRNWMMVELFEGTDWPKETLDYAGPKRPGAWATPRPGIRCWLRGFGLVLRTLGFWRRAGHGRLAGSLRPDVARASLSAGVRAFRVASSAPGTGPILRVC